MPNVVEPNDLAVSRIQERNTKLTLVLGILQDGSRVSLGLRKNSLRPERDLLGFNHTADLFPIAEGVIGWSRRRRQLRHGCGFEVACVRLLAGGRSLPAGCVKARICAGRAVSEGRFWRLRHGGSSLLLSVY